jgi:hypothetical protein
MNLLLPIIYEGFAVIGKSLKIFAGEKESLG